MVKLVDHRMDFTGGSMLEILRHKSLPAIVRLQPNLHGALFWLMKLCVGLRMIEKGLREGSIAPGGLVVESTSGTMGYGLALAARAFGIRVRLVGDPAIDPWLANLLDHLGAEIDIVTEKLPIGGYQVPRLKRLKDILVQHPSATWMKQYDNPSNPESYLATAKLLVERIGRIDYLVATTGSGGSISGTTKALRSMGQNPRVVAVDTHASVLFGQADGPRLLRGLGNSIFPKNLDYSLIDEVHWVTAADAFTLTRNLFCNFGLDVGPTTGAAYQVANWLANTYPNKSIVFIGPDRAERYLNTTYSRQWCEANDAWVDEATPQPTLVGHPSEARYEWTRMLWQRRSYQDVTGNKAQ